MCHVNLSYAISNREIAVYSPSMRIQGVIRSVRRRGEGEGENCVKCVKGKERKRMKNTKSLRRNHLATSNPLRTKLRSYRRVLVAKMRPAIYKCKRMRECFWLNDAVLRERQSEFCDRPDGRFECNKGCIAIEIRMGKKGEMLSMLTSFLLKTRPSVKIERLKNKTD